MTKIALAGSLVAENYDGWSPGLKEEFAQQATTDTSDHGCSSKPIAFASGDPAGARAALARTPPCPGLLLDRHYRGRSRQHTSDGTTREVSYHPGDSKYSTFDHGEYLLHDLNNIGETELVFVTVEHLTAQTRN